MLDFIMSAYQRGGVTMLPLSLCSLIMVTLIIERLWFLRFQRLFPKKEIQQLKHYIVADSESLQRLPIPTNHPIGRILAHGLAVGANSPLTFREAVSDQARRELHEMQRGLVGLEIIATIAPLLGLLGTALGMVQLFRNISLEGAARTEALGQGISEALLTTVSGLIIGIPALVAYTLFSRRVVSLGIYIEEQISSFFHKLFPEK